MGSTELLKERVFLKTSWLSLIFFIMTSACNDEKSLLEITLSSQPTSIEPAERMPYSMCMEGINDTEEISKNELKKLFRVMILPNWIRTGPAAFVDEFVRGLAASGWVILDSETVAKSRDPVADIQLATGRSDIPDIVAFYILRDELLDIWIDLPSSPFIKVLIVEDIHKNYDIRPARRFVEFGDGVFARYPEAFTMAVAPYKVECYAFYQAAGEAFFAKNVSADPVKNMVLLSGAMDPVLYPLRDAAKKLMVRRRDIIQQLVHPGYTYEMRPREIHRKYADTIRSFRAAIAGTAPRKAVFEPYIIAKHLEIPAVGRLMITDDFLEPYLSKLGFERDVHYVTANTNNLESVIDYWLQPENHARGVEIARNAHNLVRRRHKIEHRIELFEIATGQMYFKLRKKPVNSSLNSIIPITEWSKEARN